MNQMNASDVDIDTLSDDIRKTQVEHVFDVLGWGEGIERVFQHAEYYDNERENNYWQIDLTLPEMIKLDHATVTGIVIFESEVIPLQMEYRCIKCDGDSSGVIQLDNPDAIALLIKEDLNIDVGLV